MKKTLLISLALISFYLAYQAGSIIGRKQQSTQNFIASSSTKSSLHHSSDITVKPRVLLESRSKLKENKDLPAPQNLFQTQLENCQTAEDYVSFLETSFEGSNWLDYYDDLEKIHAFQQKFSSLPNDLMLDVLKLFSQRAAHHGYKYDLDNLMLDAAVKADPEATANYMGENEDHYPGENFSILSTWADTDPEAAINWMKNNKFMMAEHYYSDVFSKMAKKDPTLATEMLKDIAPKNRTKALKGILHSFDNFDASIAFINQLPPEFNDQKQAFSEIAQKHPEASLDWLSENKSTDSVVQRQQILKKWMQADPESAKGWILAQENTELAHKELAASLPLKEDSLKLISEALPQDKQNEAFINFITNSNSHRNNQHLINQAIEKIDSPELRESTSLDHFEKIKRDGTAALKFLKDNPDISPEQKEQLSKDLHVPIYRDRNGTTYFDRHEITKSPQQVYEVLKQRDSRVAEEYRQANTDKFPELDQ